MAYIVDGNNVMGQIPGWHRDKLKSRRLLLRKLAAFVRSKKARVIVVFDGTPDAMAPDRAAVRGVRVLYADRGSDADTRIEQLVEGSPDRRGLTVITSDRRLASAVRAQGAKVIRSGEFRKQLEQIIDSKPAEGVEQFKVSDVDAWLRYFGSSPEDDIAGNE